MRFAGNVLKTLASTWGGGSPSATRRKPRRLELSWDNLEERTALSHFGGFGGGFIHPTAITTLYSTTSSSTSSSSTNSGTSSSSSAVSTARQTLQSAVQAIELASGTTIGELTAIETAFATLRSDGLSPTSPSALASFENSLVTAFAPTSGTGGGSSALLNSDGSPNAALLSAFEGVYTTTPSTLTSTQVADLTTAYKALASAVVSSNITSANINTIITDYSALLTAEGSTSTATYPYFSLVTGGRGGGPGGGGMRGGCH